MNSLRAAKRSKRILKKVPTQDQSPEEEAKQKLIELSNLWDLNHDISNIEENPEKILEEFKGKTHTSEGRNFFNSERTRPDISVDFKKLTELLDEKQDIDLLEIRSQRHYKYGDKFIRIALRNPLTTSNFIMTGVNQQRASVANPQRSQYIIRQQRNFSRIKREQQKRSLGSFLGRKFVNSSYNNNDDSRHFTEKAQELKVSLRSQSSPLHDNHFSAKLRSAKEAHTPSFFKTKK